MNNENREDLVTLFDKLMHSSLRANISYLYILAKVRENSGCICHPLLGGNIRHDVWRYRGDILTTAVVVVVQTHNIAFLGIIENESRCHSLNSCCVIAPLTCLSILGAVVLGYLVLSSFPQLPILDHLELEV